MDGHSNTPAVSNGQFERALTFTEEKSYSIIVTATNEVGASSSAQRNVIYDITPPVFSITPAVTPTTQPSLALSGTMEEGATIVVNCATATVGVIAYPTAKTWRADISSLTAGDNVITVQALDALGNVSKTSTNIVYTAQQPTFNFAVFGNKNVYLTGGSYTDSYISTPPNIYAGQYKHGDIGQLYSIMWNKN
jgi:large repetitive protein